MLPSGIEGGLPEGRMAEKTLDQGSAGDELPHAVGPGEQWSESYYFNLFDPASRVGGFTRIGIRPNEGEMDAVLVLFLPDGSVAIVRQTKPQQENTAELEVGGVAYEMLEPFARWHVKYAGEAMVLPEPGKLLSQGPVGARQVDLAIDLDFTCVTSRMSDRVSEAATALAKQAAGPGADPTSFELGHFEQAGRWTGSITVDGEATKVEGHGIRDKSWGVRNWQAPTYWRWFSMAFGDDLAIGATLIGIRAGEIHTGWVHRAGQEPVPVNSVTVRSELEEDGRTHRRSILDLVDADGEKYHIEGDVITVCPLPLNRDGSVTLVNEGLTRWHLGDREGFGIAEYLHQLQPDGSVVEPVR